MQFYDIIMLAVMLGAVIFGAWKGLAWQVASLGAIFASYFVAINLHKPVSGYLGATEQWEGIAVMLGLYLASSLVIWVVFGYVRKIIDKVKLQEFDRHAGAILGAAKGVIVCLIITLFALSLVSDEQKHKICCTYSGHFMAKAIRKIEVVIPENVQTTLGPYLDKLDEELSHESHDHETDGHTSKTRTAGLPDENHTDDPPGIGAARTAKQVIEAGIEILNNKR